MPCLCNIKGTHYTVTFSFLTMLYTHSSEATINQNFLVYGKFIWQNLPFVGPPPIFINIFVCKPTNLVNCLEFTSHKVVHSINERKLRFSEKYAFWGKTNQFSGILNFLRIFWSDLVGAIGFSEAVDMN